ACGGTRRMHHRDASSSEILGACVARCVGTVITDQKVMRAPACIKFRSDAISHLGQPLRANHNIRAALSRSDWGSYGFFISRIFAELYMDCRDLFSSTA